MTEVARPVSPPWSKRPALDLAAAARYPVDVVLQELGSTQAGLTSEEAARRLRTVGRNVLASHNLTALGVLGRQLRNALLILLLAAAGVAAVTGDPIDGAIIAAIVVLSVGLGFITEYRSEVAVALHVNIRHHALVWRDGRQQRLDVRDLVPGDVVALRVGDLVPADLRLLEANQLECDEAVLTGEPMAVVKRAAPVPAGDSAVDLPACAFMSTVVHQGAGRGVVVATAFGKIAVGLAERQAETDDRRREPSEQRVSTRPARWPARRVPASCMNAFADPSPNGSS
jgi:P-type Mg2+ transporter